MKHVTTYNMTVKFADPVLENVIFLGSLFNFESKIVIVHPLTGKPVELFFAGLSERRHGLHKYKEATKNGQLLGG